MGTESHRVEEMQEINRIAFMFAYLDPLALFDLAFAMDYMIDISPLLVRGSLSPTQVCLSIILLLT